LADPVTYQRITLRIQHPWNYAGENVHEWSVKFNLSGGQALLQTEIEPTVVDLFEPIKLLSRSDGHLVEARYYPPEGHSATWFKLYAATDHPCTQAAYTNLQHQQQLEVSVLARAPIGKSATGKPVFLRKWIHGILADASNPNAMAAIENGTEATVLNRWNTGSGPRQIVPVDPTGGTQGGPWTFEPHLFTHQLRRGPKRKAATNTVYVPVPVP
jgi:hypothetical protein